MSENIIKIGVMSDSHRNLHAIDDVICKVEESGIDVSCWFHAGDSIDDTEYLEKVSGKKVYKVPGNVDWFTKARREILVNIGGINIYMTHGDMYQVKWGLKQLADRAKLLDADLIIYGHSHVGAKDIIDGRVFINPGSVSEPRDGLAPSFMIVTINNRENRKIDVERIFLNDKF